MQDAAKQLGVPDADLDAFKEYYEALSEAGGGRPSERSLKAWKETLQKTKAEATVRAFAKANSAKLDEAVKKAGAKPEIVIQRLVFMGIYGRFGSLDEALAQLMRELDSVAPGEVKLRAAPGRYTKQHGDCKAAAYPYSPSVSSGEGCTTIDCWDGNELAGYIAMQGDYADDLAVFPKYHGRGVAKALICAAALQLQGKRKQMSLDVRACNLPAIGTYKSLGFEVQQKYYPSFFDWHGGYSMAGRVDQILKKMPSNVDTSGM